MDKALEKDLAQLEEILRKQVATHEQLLTLLKRKKAALAHADADTMTECCRLENEQLQAVAELEKQRLTLAAKVTLALDPKAPAPLKLGDLAQKLPEPVRGRLLVLRHQARQRMEQVRHEVAVTKRATESLMGHIQGLMQTIGSAVTGIGTYNRGGSLPRAATAISTFNTTA